jgi:hypothetical protein
MSKIILQKYDNGEHRYVVGWDRPCASYFWQEFNKEPEPDQSGEVNWDDWMEMKEFGGYGVNELPNMVSFLQDLPERMVPLVTDEVKALLMEHAQDPDTGRIIVDMTEKKE